MGIKPLENRTILVTRARNQAPEFRQMLEERGGRVLELPTIEVRPRPDPELDQAVEGLNHCDWLMFTSANTVDIFMGRVRHLGGPGKDTFPRICTVGPATAEKVEKYDHSVDLIPSRYQAEGVLEDFLEFNQGQIKGLRILLPCASEARTILPQTLRRQGAEVNQIYIYDTVIPEESYPQFLQLLQFDTPDMITFTSSSTVKNLITLAKGNPVIKEIPCAVIGPITAKTALENALNIVVQPEKSTLTDLVDAMGRYFQTL